MNRTAEILKTDVDDSELAALADILRRREVKRLKYFHCDHFEPWSRAPGTLSIDDNAADVERFAHSSQSNEFARRLTLFYKAHVGYALAASAPHALLADPADAIGFLPVDPAQEPIFSNAMRGLLACVDHEIQVHVHHEHYTCNSTKKGGDMQAALDRPEIKALDSVRFGLALQLALERTRVETGQKLDSWFFVHGLWALAASDPRICQIEDEIDILMRNGCRGDFTFPAGRGNVNPRHNVPFLIAPHRGLRAYDAREARPERALGNVAAAQAKFFIWSSAIRHESSSLDTYVDWLRAKLRKPVPFARDILEKSYVGDGTLWFKTHAHSMHPLYREADGSIRFPLEGADVRRLIGTVCDAADAAGIPVEFVTAGEVYQSFVSPREQITDDFHIEVPLSVSEGRQLETGLQGEEQINAVAVEIVTERSVELGVAESGAGNYFYRRAEQGRLLMDYEIRIAEELAKRRHLFTTAIEIGSGLSVLPMLLAANGIVAIGIERDVARMALAREIEARLAEPLPQISGACTLIRGAVPAALHALDLAGAALVFTNITATFDDAAVEELLTISQACRLMAIDLSRFFMERDAYEQDALQARLARFGWTRASPLGGSYWLFENERSIVDGRQ